MTNDKNPIGFAYRTCIIIHAVLIRRCPSDGTLNGAPCQGKQPIGKQKIVSLDFDEE